MKAPPNYHHHHRLYYSQMFMCVCQTCASITCSWSYVEVSASLFMSVYLLRSVCHSLRIGGQHMLLISAISIPARRLYCSPSFLFLSQSFPPLACIKNIFSHCCRGNGSMAPRCGGDEARTRHTTKRIQVPIHILYFIPYTSTYYFSDECSNSSVGIGKTFVQH